MPELPPETNETTRAGNCVMRILVFTENIPNTVWPHRWAPDRPGRGGRTRGGGSPGTMGGPPSGSGGRRGGGRHTGRRPDTPGATPCRHTPPCHGHVLSEISAVMTPALPLVTQDLVTADAVCYRLRLLDLSSKCKAVLMPVRVLIHATLLRGFISQFRIALCFLTFSPRLMAVSQA